MFFFPIFQKDKFGGFVKQQIKLVWPNHVINFNQGVLQNVTTILVTTVLIFLLVH